VEIRRIETRVRRKRIGIDRDFFCLTAFFRKPTKITYLQKWFAGTPGFFG
jgi:hypothetical protein